MDVDRAFEVLAHEVVHFVDDVSGQFVYGGFHGPRRIVAKYHLGRDQHRTNALDGVEDKPVDDREEDGEDQQFGADEEPDGKVPGRMAAGVPMGYFERDGSGQGAGWEREGSGKRGGKRGGK